MRTMNCYKQHACIVIIFISSILSVEAQTVPDPKIETPNVSNVEKFGDVPIDLSTGTPDIDIPVHTLTYGAISVPISLRYHPSSVKVAQHPGWVGMGWDLQSFGAITRQVNWLPDEFYGSNIMGSTNTTYFPEPVSNPPTSGAALVDVSDWNTQSKLHSYFGSANISDVSADEFSFNFMGYSGKFYYAGPTNGWQVVSDQNIQVQPTNITTPRLSGDNVANTVISEYSAASASGHLFVQFNDLQPTATAVFSGFTITVPNGNKYYFGDASGAGIEFYTPYGTTGIQFNANTWLLTKIVDVDGNKVDFQYSASYPTAELGFGFNYNDWNCQGTSGGFLGGVNASGAGGSGMDVNNRGGRLMLPLYLDKISSPNETVTFNRTVTNNCLRFSDDVYRYVESVNKATKFNLSLLGDGTTINGNTINGPNNIQWEQLNSINVVNTYSQTYKTFKFTYSNVATQRLTLQTFTEFDNTGTSVKKYAFAYNIPSPIVPYVNTVLYDANFTDHWGFFNSQTLASSDASPDGQVNSIFIHKQTDISVVTNGLLNQITFPTGGYTKFTWQAHDYSKVVSSNRQSLTSATGYAGGSRIGRIQSYLPDGNLALDKRFLYVHGYSSSTTTGTSSSGVLNGISTYHMDLTNRPGFNNNINETIHVTELNSLATYSYNSQGNYIGYDEVAVVDADGSYSKNYFTSYGPDLNGISHFDIAPAAMTGWILGDVYFPMTTLEVERGKLAGIFQYSSKDILVQKAINTYRSDPARFNSFVKFINYNGGYSGCAGYDALILSTATKKFTYSYYIAKTDMTNYDQSGNNPITSSTAFTYNSNNLISTKTEVNSKGESLITAYKYPNEIDNTDPGYTTYQSMTSVHIISPVIQTSVTKNGVLLSLTKSNYYSPSTGMYKPQNIQMQFNNNTIETRQKFYQYDNHGNINEVSKANDTHEVYLWGYNGQYPVAKITGSTYSAVTALVTQAQIDAATATANNDANVRSLLKGLRSGLPNALVTYYTYQPVTGITSETDARGQITYYQYDTFQRLKQIADYKGNIIKTFSYQYQISQ